MLKEVSENIFDAFCNGEKYASLEIDYIKKTAHLHFNITKWSHSILKENKKDFEAVKKMVSKKAARIAVSFNESVGDVQKWKKYISILGFPEPQIAYISIMEATNGT